MTSKGDYKFSRAEAEAIANRYASSTETIKEIAACLTVNEKTLRNAFKRYHINSRRRTLTDFERTDIVQRYIAGENYRAIAAKHRLSETTVYNVLRDAGIDRVHKSERRCTLDESAFDVITPECAYWIGFLMADGAISDTKAGQPCVKLALAQQDAAHVERFRDFLKSSHSLWISRTGSVRLMVPSQRLVEALARYGVTPRKSHTATVIGLENDIDFWRGVLDGDGTIHLSGRKRSNSQIRLVGSQFLLVQFAAFVASLTPDSFARALPYRSIFSYTLTGGRAARLAEVLYYPGCVALPRKFERAQQVIALFAS